MRPLSWAPIGLNDGPIRIRSRDIGQDALVHVLGPAIRIGAAGRHGLVQRHMIRNSIHSGRRAEDKALNAVLLHRFAHSQSAVEVIAVILHRLSDGLADSLVRSKVNNRIDLVFGKDLIHRRRIAAVSLVELDGLASQLFDALQRLLAAVVEVIDNNNAVSSIKQFYAGMGTDESRTASRKDVHGMILLSCAIIDIFRVYIIPLSARHGNAIYSSTSTARQGAPFSPYSESGSALR